MTQDLLISIMMFVLGCLFGSFLSVLVHRTLHRQSGIIFGKSRCPKCKHPLRPRELIPVLSWLFQRGRCSYCHKPISAIYPALELVTGLLFLTNYNMVLANPAFTYFANFSFDWIFVVKIIYLGLIVLNLTAIFFSDLQKKAIPNLFLYSWVILTAFSFLLSGAQPFDNLLDRLTALGIALLIFGGQYLISKGKWLGSGDIFVAAGMGLLLGLNSFLVAVAFTYILGSVISLGLLLLKKVKFSQSVPFAPFLILGTLIALYHGQEIIDWYWHLFLII